MNDQRPLSAKAAILAALAASVLALCACEEQSYSGPATPPPPPPPAAPLAGAPEAPPPSPYASAEAAPPSDYTPAPEYAPPPPPPAYQPAPAYPDNGLVAMAPIPNPGDPGSEGYYPNYRGAYRDRARAEYAPRANAPYEAREALRHRRHEAARMAERQAPAAAPAPARRTTSAAAKSITPRPTTHAAPVPQAQARTPAYAPTTRAPALVHHGLATAAGAAAGAHALTHAKTVKTSKVAGSRADRLAALQTDLTDAVSRDAKLAAPDHFTAGQPTDVTLTLPSAFADTLRAAAEKNGLTDAAASVHMSALLSGDGFTVSPAETQSEPLIAGQLTEWRWTVTAEPNAKGPLHADVGANLLGGASEALALGSVQKAAGPSVNLTPKVIGAAILALIAALVLAWLARVREPSKAVAARRRASRPPPFDIQGRDDRIG